jgi:SAM-dependent methyltransferase
MDRWNEADDASLDRYRQWQFDLIAPYLGEQVLEIGAGHGRFAAAARARRGSFERYLALEPGEHFFRGLERLQATAPWLEVRNTVVDALPESYNRAFDTVFAIHVMEHIEDDAAFLRCCLEKVTDRGYVVMLVPALNALYSELDRKIGHFRRYDKRMIRALARRSGAQVAACRYDNVLGIVGWWWLCKVRGIDYHTESNKQALVGSFDFFSRYVLPLTASIERVLPPPVGLNLTAVFQRTAIPAPL